MRAGAIVILVLTSAAGMVAVGRWERARADARIRSGMTAVVAEAGPIRGSRLAAYRLTPSFDCLLYRSGPDPYALELCFDREGRLIEAIDRRTRHVKFWSFRFDPAASRIRIAVPRLVAVFRAIHAPGTGTTLPLGYSDGGPTLIQR